MRTSTLDERATQRRLHRQLVEKGLTDAACPWVVSATTMSEKNFCFIEFDTVEHATLGMALDGVVFEVRTSPSFVFFVIFFVHGSVSVAPVCPAFVCVFVPCFCLLAFFCLLVSCYV